MNEQLTGLCELVWQTFDLPLAETHAPDLTSVGRALQGNISISGDVAATVTVQCSMELANAVARHMFGDIPLSPEDVQDTVGELTNIVGGNVKALLSEGGGHLSLPVVVEGSDFSVRVPGSCLVSRVTFGLGEMTAAVTVLQSVERHVGVRVPR